MSIDPLLALRLEHFSALLGSNIPMDLGDGPVSAEVIAAERIGGYTTREGGSFSVMLKVPVSGRPAQGTFPVELPEFGQLQVFMSPRRVDNGLATYEFIFN
jgi:hypothetical protein